MKMRRIFSLCLALCLSMCLFAGCSGQDDPEQTQNPDSAMTTNGLELVEGQDETIELDEGEVEDPFGE